MTRTSLYRPEGYPEFGLATSQFLPSPSRQVAQAVAHYEHTYKEPSFALHGFTKMPVPLARELAQVYLSLSERHPGVRIASLSFAPSPHLAQAHQFVTGYSTLRKAMQQFGTGNLKEVRERVLESDPERRHQRTRQILLELIAARSNQHRACNLRAHGAIRFGDWVFDPREYRRVSREYDVEATTSWNKASAVSVGAAVLIHEYGHVLSEALEEKSLSARRRVYDALDTAVLPPATRQSMSLLWMSVYNVNDSRYPHDFDRDTVHDVVAPHIRRVLGTYATTNRLEMFAEAFKSSICATDPRLRRRLAPFRTALVSTGLATS